MSEFVLHLRGLPFRASEQEIVNFLEVDPNLVSEVDISKMPDGRPSGEGFVVMSTQESAEQALGKHKETMPGYGRYIEIFEANRQKMNVGFNSGGSGGRQGSGVWDGVVKLRGLPYECGLTEVETFFQGLTWAKNGITIPLNERGNCSGEAYVQFDTYTSANSALERNNQSVGGRYIELFKSSNNDRRKAIIQTMQIKEKMNPGQPPQQQQMNTPPQQWGGMNISGGGGGPQRNNFQQNRPAPYNIPQNNFGNFNGNQGGYQQQPPAVQQQPPMMQQPVQTPPAAPAGASPFPHMVGLNGLPQGATNVEIQDFFRPHKAVAVNNHGNGYCDVAFKTHEEASAAMDKNGQMLKNVAVSLMLKSTAPVTAPQPTGWQSY